MKRKYREFPLEVRGVDAAGEFEGYASVFDEIDYYREVVVPGAFSNTIKDWKAKGRYPAVLWQHMRGEPIGPILQLEERERGLWFRGRLLYEDVQRAREARALMQAKAISGVSIGFDIPDGGEEYDSKAGILKLKELDLWEVSVVTFPANEAAQVEAVKAAFPGKLPTIVEFERFLREAGFSRSHAKAIAGHGLGRILREAGTGKAAGSVGGVDVRSILDAVREGIR